MLNNKRKYDSYNNDNVFKMMMSINFLILVTRSFLTTIALNYIKYKCNLFNVTLKEFFKNTNN